MKRFTRRERISVFICILFTIGFILFNLLIEPSIAKWSRINSLLFQNRYKLDRYELIIKDCEKYPKRIKQLKTSLGNIQKRLYYNETPILATNNLLQDIETIAKNNGITIQSKDTLPSKKIDGYNEIFVDLHITCDSEMLTNFLYELKTSHKLYLVPYLNISSIKESNDLEVCLTVSSLQIAKR